MRFRATLIAVATLTAAVSGAHDFTDSGMIDPPWCGWWWPSYHDPNANPCIYCPHMWQGPGFVPDAPGSRIFTRAA